MRGANSGTLNARRATSYNADEGSGAPYGQNRELAGVESVLNDNITKSPTK